MSEAEGYRSLQQLKENINLADSLKGLHESSQKSLELMQAVPADGRSSFILNKLLSGSKRYGLVLSDINSLDEVAHGSYLEFPFELSVAGEFIDLQKYLIDLENMDVVVKMRRLLINAPKMNKPSVKAHLEISAYVLVK
jgi:Tfp pilus assembly protein PilO